MAGNYPPGVTGYEPQIAGYGNEDKCTRCLDEYPDLKPNDGEVEVCGQRLCAVCAETVITDELSLPEWGEFVEWMQKQKAKEASK